jgi:hypothetical protein
MIPILEAEESIRIAQAVAVGTGSIKNPRAMLDEWERVARALDAPAAAAAPRKPPALFSDEVLARLPVRRVPTTRKG